MESKVLGNYQESGREVSLIGRKKKVLENYYKKKVQANLAEQFCEMMGMVLDGTGKYHKNDLTFIGIIKKFLKSTRRLQE